MEWNHWSVTKYPSKQIKFCRGNNYSTVKPGFICILSDACFICSHTDGVAQKLVVIWVVHHFCVELLLEQFTKWRSVLLHRHQTGGQIYWALRSYCWLVDRGCWSFDNYKKHICVFLWQLLCWYLQYVVVLLTAKRVSLQWVWMYCISVWVPVNGCSCHSLLSSH